MLSDLCGRIEAIRGDRMVRPQGRPRSGGSIAKIVPRKSPRGWTAKLPVPRVELALDLDRLLGQKTLGQLEEQLVGFALFSRRHQLAVFLRPDIWMRINGRYLRTVPSGWRRIMANWFSIPAFLPIMISPGTVVL